MVRLVIKMAYPVFNGQSVTLSKHLCRCLGKKKTNSSAFEMLRVLLKQIAKSKQLLYRNKLCSISCRSVLYINFQFHWIFNIKFNWIFKGFFEQKCILFYGQLDLTEIYYVIKNAYFIHILILTNRKFYTKKKTMMFYDFILLDTIVTCD